VDTMFCRASSSLTSRKSKICLEESQDQEPQWTDNLANGDGKISDIDILIVHEILDLQV
jgi:hypothetical protein